MGKMVYYSPQVTYIERSFPRDVMLNERRNEEHQNSSDQQTIVREEDRERQLFRRNPLAKH